MTEEIITLARQYHLLGLRLHFPLHAFTASDTPPALQSLSVRIFTQGVGCFAHSRFPLSTTCFHGNPYFYFALLPTREIHSEWNSICPHPLLRTRCRHSGRNSSFSLRLAGENAHLAIRLCCPISVLILHIMLGSLSYTGRTATILLKRIYAWCLYLVFVLLSVCSTQLFTRQYSRPAAPPT